MLSYTLRDLLRNPRRTIASVAGVALAVGLFSGIVFFVDSSAAAMTQRAIAPVAIDMQAGLNAPLTPTAAGTPAPLEWSDLHSRLARVPGVATADRLASVDFPAGSLGRSGKTLALPLRLFAFDLDYLVHYPMVRLSSGSYAPGTALVSPATAQALGAGPGANLSLSVPGRTQALPLSLGGIADFSAADALFTSRAADTQGEFVQVPNVVVVTPEVFSAEVLPALHADAASPNPALKSPPYLEVDLRIDRARLVTDPTLAVLTTQGLKRTIERLAPGQIRVIDNLSQVLSAARSDVILAKALFLFLGLPGVILAGYLSRYAGSLLAQAQRRERATLRARGAQPSHLLRALAYNTIAVGLLGSVLGLGLGLAAVVLIFGTGAVSGAPVQSLGLSTLLSVAAGLLTTALAIYLPGRRSMARETGEERREVELAAPSPAWLRLRLDLIFLAGAALVAGVTYLSGGFKPTNAEGQSVSLSFYTLLAPLLAWLGATLLGLRLALMLASRLPDPAAAGFIRVVRDTLGRSVRRRPGGLGAGVIAISLSVAFGTSLAVFVSSYEAEQQAGARFVVGSDVRVTPSALSRQPAGFASRLSTIPGVAGVTPVLEVQNAQVGNDKRNLVAVDAGSLPAVAYLPDSFFSGTSAAGAVSALRNDPAGVLVSTEMANSFNIQPGDQVTIQLRDAAGNQVPGSLHAVGLFVNFPGFPQGTDLVGNLAYYQKLTGTANVDFFLVKTAASDPTSVGRVASLIRSGPGQPVPLRVQTTTTAYNVDQSSLASINLRGLGDLESAYTVLMSAGGIAIFVFGLILQRRKEYVTMRALGIRMAQLRGLVLGEAGLAALLSLAIGAPVGAVMAVMFVKILGPLFTVGAGRIVIPADRLGLLAGAVLGGMALAATMAAAALSRLNPVELLREE